MKARILSIGAALVAAIWAIAPVNAENIKGNGEVVTKEFSVEDYDGIIMGGIRMSGSQSFLNMFKSNTYVAPTFNYKQGSAATLKITTDENIMPYLTAKVTDGNLRIRVKSGYSIAPTQLDFDGTSKELERVSVSSGGNFYLQSSLEGEKLDASVSGGRPDFGRLFCRSQIACGTARTVFPSHRQNRSNERQRPHVLC